LRAYKVDLEQFIGNCHALGVERVQDVTVEVFDDFVTNLIHGCFARAATVNRKIETVRTLMRHAIADGVIENDPTAGVRVLSELRRDPSAERKRAEELLSRLRHEVPPLGGSGLKVEKMNVSR
jgi:site-specific recombinase XerD